MKYLILKGCEAGISTDMTEIGEEWWRLSRFNGSKGLRGGLVVDWSQGLLKWQNNLNANINQIFKENRGNIEWKTLVNDLLFGLYEEICN